MTRNYFKNSIFYLVPLICGLISTFSLPPYNFFFLNFISFPFLLLIYLNLEIKKGFSSFFYGWIFGFSYFFSNIYWIANSLTVEEIFKPLIPFAITIIPLFLGIEYIIKTPKKSVIPRSEKQKNYVRALRESDIIISCGPAGTGKTFLAVAVALTMLLDKKIERIILSRPAVEAGERLGFLPGDMREKVDPYLRPLYDSLYDLLDFEKIQKRIEIGDIEIAPLAFMRGRTLKNSFAILDEAQNATDTQIKMFLTRIGENSKIVINGDPSQIDLPNKSLSGLNRSKKLLGHLNEISVVDFDHSDVVRHPLVSKIVKAYSDQNKD